MEKINSTTLAAAKMLEAAIEMMKAEASGHCDAEKDILKVLMSANAEIRRSLSATSLNETEESAKRRREVIYTDGACSGNPGPGGWGLVRIVDGDEENLQRRSHGYRRTTNNRMELWAAISALEMFRDKKSDIEIISDSKYLTDAINKGWLKNWAKDEFERPANPDLWQYLYRLLQKAEREGHKVSFTWIKGHAGHTWNEVADDLAVNAANQSEDSLSIDTEYEKAN